MYVVSGRITTRSSFEETAKRMEAGFGPILLSRPGFRGYYVIQTGERTGDGVLVFDTASEWAAVQDEVLAWFQENIRPQLEGDGAVSAGECIVALEPGGMAARDGAASSAEARPH